MKNMNGILTGFDLMNKAEGDEYIIVTIEYSKEQYVLCGGNMGRGNQHLVNRKLIRVYAEKDMLDIPIEKMTGYKCIKKDKLHIRRKY